MVAMEYDRAMVDLMAWLAAQKAYLGEQHLVLLEQEFVPHHAIPLEIDLICLLLLHDISEVLMADVVQRRKIHAPHCESIAFDLQEVL
jgi:hypothetical protein